MASIKPKLEDATRTGERNVLLEINDEAVLALLPILPKAARNACRSMGIHLRSAEIEDLQQEVLLRLIKDGYRRLGSFKGQGSLCSWLEPIAKRCLCNRLRNQRPTIDIGELDPDTFAIPATQESELICKRRHDQLELALGLLTDRERFLFELLQQGDLTVADIASRLGITIASVHTYKHRLRKKLRQLFDQTAHAKKSNRTNFRKIIRAMFNFPSETCLCT